MSMICLMVLLLVMGACFLRKYAFIKHEGYVAVTTIVGLSGAPTLFKRSFAMDRGDHNDVTVYRALASSLPCQKNKRVKRKVVAIFMAWLSC